MNDTEQRMVFGANTYRAFAQMLASATEDSEARDPWVTRMRNLPARGRRGPRGAGRLLPEREFLDHQAQLYRRREVMLPPGWLYGNVRERVVLTFE